MALFYEVLPISIRDKPKYKATLEEEVINIDCDYLRDDILDVFKNYPVEKRELKIEQILTEAKLPEILKRVTKGTVIYSYMKSGIVSVIESAVRSAGFTVGRYTGEDKSGLEKFKDYNIDVLVCSRAIGTGVDGLQERCNNFIINILPWTDAEYKQAKARVYRRGQENNTKVTILRTRIKNPDNGKVFSIDGKKWSRIKEKRDLASCAVDGIIPKHILSSPGAAIEEWINEWLKEIKQEDGDYIVEEPKIYKPLESTIAVIDLPSPSSKTDNRKLGAKTAFGEIGGRWNNENSSTTHARLQKNSQEWYDYHEARAELKREDPLNVIIEDLKKYPSERKVADLGCGWDIRRNVVKLAEVLRGIHRVKSYDHIAPDGSITTCDMAHVPIENGYFDNAVYCLSMMGQNCEDYFIEANRILKFDCPVHIMVPSYWIPKDFKYALAAFGFRNVEIKEIDGQFTYVTAYKKGPINDRSCKIKWTRKKLDR
jgi:hypothetical protein